MTTILSVRIFLSRDFSVNMNPPLDTFFMGFLAFRVLGNM